MRIFIHLVQGRSKWCKLARGMKSKATGAAICSVCLFCVQKETFDLVMWLVLISLITAPLACPLWLHLPPSNSPKPVLWRSDTNSNVNTKQLEGIFGKWGTLKAENQWKNLMFDRVWHHGGGPLFGITITALSSLQMSGSLSSLAQSQNLIKAMIYQNTI